MTQMTRSKPKVGGRVYWQTEDGPKEYGTILQVVGSRMEVRWDNPPEYHEADDTFTYPTNDPASCIRLVCQ
jgi:hypothetical protein